MLFAILSVTQHCCGHRDNVRHLNRVLTYQRCVTRRAPADHCSTIHIASYALPNARCTVCLRWTWNGYHIQLTYYYGHGAANAYPCTSLGFPSLQHSGLDSRPYRVSDRDDGWRRMTRRRQTASATAAAPTRHTATTCSRHTSSQSRDRILLLNSLWSGLRAARRRLRAAERQNKHMDVGHGRARHCGTAHVQTQWRYMNAHADGAREQASGAATSRTTSRRRGRTPAWRAAMFSANRANYAGNAVCRSRRLNILSTLRRGSSGPFKHQRQDTLPR